MDPLTHVHSPGLCQDQQSSLGVIQAGGHGLGLPPVPCRFCDLAAVVSVSIRVLGFRGPDECDGATRAFLSCAGLVHWRLHSSHFWCCTHAVVGTCSRCQVLDTEDEPGVPAECGEDWVRVCMPVG